VNGGIRARVERRTQDRIGAVVQDSHASFAEAYALGALAEPERASFEAHLGAGCLECRTAVAAHQSTILLLNRQLEPRPPRAVLRQQVLDLAEAPALPDDLEALDWHEIGPGIRLRVVREDAARGMRACLVWAKPGARHPLHRHLGDELILVLRGALGDERASYGPGEICRSQEGSVHSERVLSSEDCVCYVVYYGGLEMLESGS
jgi:anti-sigma factor ChrR (cupin superfamily)